MLRLTFNRASTEVTSGSLVTYTAPSGLQINARVYEVDGNYIQIRYWLQTSETFFSLMTQWIDRSQITIISEHQAFAA